MASKESEEFETFAKAFDDLEVQLETSCTGVASKSYAAGLIDEDLMDAVIDKNPVSQYDRALLLIGRIGKTIRRANAEQAKTTMDTFMKILGKEASFRHLTERIGIKSL